MREDTLTPGEKETLDRNGYLLLPDILTPEQVRACGDRMEELLALEGEDAGKEVHQEAGADRLADLINKGEMFTVCFTHPRVLAAVAHILQSEFHFSSLNSRAALPGQGQQHLHLDLDEAPKPGGYYGCNSIWLMDDFTEENGATRVVPGSHRSGKVPCDEMVNPGDPHPREIKLTAPAGTVFIINAHTWHGGTTNRTNRPRRAMHGYFCHRDYPQQLDQRKYIRPETYARLSEAARYILDV